MTKFKTYLGDGVYIDLVEPIDGTVVLTTEDGIEETNRIVMEPEVLRAYTDWLMKVAGALRGGDLT